MSRFPHVTLVIVALTLQTLSTRAAIAAERMTDGYSLRPVSFEKVTLSDNFWLPRLHIQRRVLVPYAFQQTEDALNDLRAAAEVLARKRSAEKLDNDEAAKIPGPHRYRTSDLFKVMEGAAYLLAIERDPELERQMDEIIETIAAAQEPDGYLNATRTLYPHTPIKMMGDDRYAYVDHSHELYIVGHMYEAAVAYFRATGKPALLEVAERNARHVHRVFFEGDPNYNGGKPKNQAPGHEEIELALVKLADVTGERDYLKTAQRFLDIRGVTYVPQGEGVFSATYNQQHKPVTEQAEPVGHAVRATYLYAGMADVGAMLGSDRYNDALERIWRNIVDTRMHITGGLGAVHGIEGFGPEYELPNADAFNETCAAVGNVFFNWRMFLLHRDARYLDVAELALYNNVLAGMNLGGDRFFYLNPLAADGARPFNHGRPERSPWFNTACCPTNIARLVPQAPGMIFATDDEGLTLCLYAASRTQVDLNGVPTELIEETNYPYDGRIKLTLRPEKKTKFAVRLRIPTWATDRIVPGELYRYADSSDEQVQLLLNDEPVKLKIEKGFASIDREWSLGDEIVLELPMPVRASVCRTEVAANRKRIAISRGPLVYCVESPDNAGHAFNYMAPSQENLAEAKLEKLSFEGHQLTAIEANSRRLDGGEVRSANLTLIPYYAWNNRGVSSMAVWLPTDVETLRRDAMDDAQSSLD